MNRPPPATGSPRRAAQSVGSSGVIAASGQTSWAATFLNGFEAWANYRRLGLPALTQVNWPSSVTGGVIPKRLPYPVNEVQLNAQNLNEAVARQGVNGTADYSTPVWWDVN